MNDIVPKLLESVLQDFRGNIAKDIKISRILSGENKTASLAEVSGLADNVGEYAYQSLKKNLTAETLPDATLYWNIAKRVIVPLMQEAQNTILDMAEIVQKSQDKKDGIGIKPIRPDFNRERVETVINKVVFLSLMPEVPDA